MGWQAQEPRGSRVKEAADKITGQNHNMVNLDVALYIDDLLKSQGNPK
jgi:pyrimidine operon attenuation protein/uracil phosphoribosyltransferase